MGAHDSAADSPPGWTRTRQLARPPGCWDAVRRGTTDAAHGAAASVPVLVGLIAATAWACYAFLRVNYAILRVNYAILSMAILRASTTSTTSDPVSCSRRRASSRRAT